MFHAYNGHIVSTVVGGDLRAFFFCTAAHRCFKRFVGLSVRCVLYLRLPLAAARFAGQVKAHYRGIFQEHNHGYDDYNGDEKEEEEGDGEWEQKGEDEEKEDNDDYSEDDSFPSPPEGADALQKASAWYFVAHSPDHNPYMREALCREGDYNRRPPMMFLSFPWVSAHEHLCVIKRAKTTANK